MLSADHLNSLKKQDLVTLFLEKQQECAKLQDLTDLIKSMDKRLSELESRISISANTSSLLSNRVKTLEKELLASQQYSRRECIEIDGIDLSIKNDELESSVQKILGDINVKISVDVDIQACHRIGKKGTVIVKFSNRKTVGSVLKNKSKLRQQKGNVTYINESLCAMNRKIRGCCNALRKQGLIGQIQTRNGMVMIRISNEEDLLLVDHKDILVDKFPNFQFRF